MVVESGGESGKSMVGESGGRKGDIRQRLLERLYFHTDSYTTSQKKDGESSPPEKNYYISCFFN